MKYGAPFVCVVLILLSALASASEYMTVEEYHRKHPEQRRISDDFASRVRQKGVPMAPRMEKKGVKIAFVYPGKQVSDYWRRSILSFKKRMDEIGVTHEMSEYFSKPVVDYRMQERQMKKALKQNPDYLVFTLDAWKHKRIISRILTRGKPRLILQNITTPLRIWEGGQPFLYVGFDHKTGTRMLADHFIKETGGQGDYALLYFSRGYVSEMRGDSFIRFVKDGSGLKLRASYYTDGNRAKAKKAALEIIKTQDVKFIYACSTDVALGAIDALKETGNIGRIAINGWGGGESELGAIARGEMDVTVMRVNDDNGVAMAEAIRLHTEGESERVPTVFSGNFFLVKKGFSKSKIDEFKGRAFRYSSLPDNK